jgi:hypothetical protein
MWMTRKPNYVRMARVVTTDAPQMKWGEFIDRVIVALGIENSRPKDTPIRMEQGIVDPLREKSKEFIGKVAALLKKLPSQKINDYS